MQPGTDDQVEESGEPGVDFLQPGTDHVCDPGEPGEPGDYEPGQFAASSQFTIPRGGSLKLDLSNYSNINIIGRSGHGEACILNGELHYTHDASGHDDVLVIEYYANEDDDDIVIENIQINTVG